MENYYRSYEASEASVSWIQKVIFIWHPLWCIREWNYNKNMFLFSCFDRCGKNFLLYAFVFSRIYILLKSNIWYQFSLYSLFVASCNFIQASDARPERRSFEKKTDVSSQERSLVMNLLFRRHVILRLYMRKAVC